MGVGVVSIGWASWQAKHGWPALQMRGRARQLRRRPPDRRRHSPRLARSHTARCSASCSCFQYLEPQGSSTSTTSGNQSSEARRSKVLAPPRRTLQGAKVVWAVRGAGAVRGCPLLQGSSIQGLPVPSGQQGSYLSLHILWCARQRVHVCRRQVKEAGGRQQHPRWPSRRHRLSSQAASGAGWRQRQQST